MKLSTAKAFCEEPTERQNITGTWVFLSAQPTLNASAAIGNVGEALRPRSVRRRCCALPQPSERVIEPTAVRKSKAVGMPSAPERGLEPQGGLRAVAVVLDVLLARPHQLDRLAERLGHLDRLTQLIVDRAPPEAAAEIAVVNEHVARIDAPDLRRQFQRGVRRLRADPGVDPLGTPMRPSRSAAPSARGRDAGAS